MNPLNFLPKPVKNVLLYNRLKANKAGIPTPSISAVDKFGHVSEFDDQEDFDIFQSLLSYLSANAPSEEERDRYTYFYDMASQQGRHKAGIIEEHDGRIKVNWGKTDGPDNKLLNDTVAEADATYDFSIQTRNFIKNGLRTGLLQPGGYEDFSLPSFLRYNIDNATGENKKRIQQFADGIDGLRGTSGRAVNEFQYNFIRNSINDYVEREVHTPEAQAKFIAEEAARQHKKNNPESKIDPEVLKRVAQDALDNLGRQNKLHEISLEQIVEAFDVAENNLTQQRGILEEDYGLDKESLAREYTRSFENSLQTFNQDISGARGVAANTAGDLGSQALGAGQSIAAQGAIDPSLVTSGQSDRLQRLAGQQYQSGLLGVRQEYQGDRRQALYGRGVRDTRLAQDQTTDTATLDRGFGRAFDDNNKAIIESQHGRDTSIYNDRVNFLEQQITGLTQSQHKLLDDKTGQIVSGAEGEYNKLGTLLDTFRRQFDTLTSNRVPSIEDRTRKPSKPHPGESP